MIIPHLSSLFGKYNDDYVARNKDINRTYCVNNFKINVIQTLFMNFLYVFPDLVQKINTTKCLKQISHRISNCLRGTI